MLNVIGSIKSKPIFLQMSFHTDLIPPFDHPEGEPGFDYQVEFITYFCTMDDIFSGSLIDMSNRPLNASILDYIVITC